MIELFLYLGEYCVLKLSQPSHIHIMYFRIILDTALDFI